MEVKTHMWTCSLLKKNGWRALSGRYWRSFWVCLVASLLGGVSTGISIQLTFTLGSSVNYLQAIPTRTALTVLAGFLLALIGLFLWDIFVGCPLTVGLCRYFMESRQAPSPLRTIFSVFRTPYLNLVKVYFLTSLKIAVGLLLFLIPGIYWAFCYALVPYLLAENPYLTTFRAMELSKEMMEGEKFHFFILHLSFLGWLLLCFLTRGIGSFFLCPYQQATYAEFYAAMRAKAFARGMTSSQELGGFVRHEFSDV